MFGDAIEWETVFRKHRQQRGNIVAGTSPFPNTVWEREGPVYVASVNILPELGEKRSAFTGNWTGWIPAHGAQTFRVVFQPRAAKKYRSWIGTVSTNETETPITAELTGFGN